LERATIDAVEHGVMTKDLAIVVKGTSNVKKGKDFVKTEDYMDKVD